MTDDEIPLTRAGHQAAHILLDAIAAWDPSRPNDFTAPDSQLPRLIDVGAVKVDGDGVDIQGLLQGAGTTIVALLAAVAHQSHVTIPQVIDGLRVQLDGLPREG